MELLLVVAFGIRPRIPDRLDADDDLMPAADADNFPWPLLCRLVFLGQVLAFLVGILLSLPLGWTWWLEIAWLPMYDWYFKIINFLAGLAGLEDRGGVIMPVGDDDPDYSDGQWVYVTVVLMPACVVFTCIALSMCLFLLVFPLVVFGVGLSILRRSFRFLVDSYRVATWSVGRTGRRTRYVARAGVVCALVWVLIYYNLLWDGTGTWKEDWTEKIA
jgi:hypothetical protein